MTVRPFKDGKYYMIDFRYDTPDGRKRCREVCEQPGKRAAQDFEVRRRRELEEEAAAKPEEVTTTEPETPTLTEWVSRWHEDRRALVSWKTDKSRLDCHILPELGPLRLDEVRPRHLIALVKKLQSAGAAPRTIRSIYGLCQALFRDAIVAELIPASPCVLRERELGPVVDKNPEWRAGAIFTCGELEMLISDDRIPVDRRVLNALGGVGALRHGEAAGLRWRHYDPEAKPLGKLAIVTSYDRGRTKSSKPREMPVHPTLAAILAEWKLTGWGRMFGRRPGADDLVLPVAPGGKADGGSMRKAHNSWLAMQGDLDDLGFRRRRVHDLRRTMISLARADGARPDILKLCTHGSSKQMIDLYTSLPWETLCEEVGKLRVRRRGTASVIQLPVTPSDENLGNGVGNSGQKPGQAVEIFSVPNGI